jgi:hypothetical protein
VIFIYYFGTDVLRVGSFLKINLTASLPTLIFFLSSEQFINDNSHQFSHFSAFGPVGEVFGRLDVSSSAMFFLPS